MAQKSKTKIKFIYNPKAGKKRNFFSSKNKISIEKVKNLFKKYDLSIDTFPTRKPFHATELARNAKKEGYEMVVVAGGDGTINEAANGLVTSSIPLGIVPLGTFMNIAKMLSIPTDIEKAVELIKIKRIRKIDMGVVSKMNGDILEDPYYFIETSGIGIDAPIQKEGKKLEKGNLFSLFKSILHIVYFRPSKIKIMADKKEYSFESNLVQVANGPYTGAGLKMAPDAKLNDQFLTVVIYQAEKIKLITYMLNLLLRKKTDRRKIKTIKAKKVVVTTKSPLSVHADACMFGKTPVSFYIKPACLNVICGFADSKETSSLQ